MAPALAACRHGPTHSTYCIRESMAPSARRRGPQKVRRVPACWMQRCLRASTSLPRDRHRAVSACQRIRATRSRSGSRGATDFGAGRGMSLEPDFEHHQHPYQGSVISRMLRKRGTSTRRAAVVEVWRSRRPARASPAICRSRASSQPYAGGQPEPVFLSFNDLLGKEIAKRLLEEIPNACTAQLEVGRKRR